MVLAVVTAVGCGTSEPGPASETTTDSRASATTAVDMLYDPCVAIDDALTASAGYDPASRLREEGTLSGITGISCRFTGESRRLLIESNNGSFDVFKSRRADQWRADELINGRETFIFYDPANKYACNALLRTDGGLVVIVSTVQISYMYLEEPCDGIFELATLIEPTIGEGN